MPYVKIKDGVVSKYPYTIAELTEEHPNCFFPDGDYSSVGVFNVKFDPVPAYDATRVTISVMETPVERDGEWVIGFNEIPLSNEAIEQNLLSQEQAEIQQFVQGAEARLNAFVSTRAYDNVDSASKYKDLSDEDLDSIPEHLRAYVLKFRSESRYIMRVTAWTWAKLYTILDEVKSGHRAKPASFADIESELPELNWDHAV